MLGVLVLGVFLSGVLTIRAVNSYATKEEVKATFVAHETLHENLSAKLETIDQRLVRLEVNVDWIKDSLKALASRTAVRIPPDPLQE